MKQVAFWLLAGCLVNSCRPADVDPGLPNGIRITDKLMASFELLDSGGRVSTRFQEGENFQFRFRFRNTSDDSLRVDGSNTFSRLFMLSYPTFLSVVQKVADGQAPRLMGRAINSGTTGDFFTPGSIGILPRTTLTYQAPWQSTTSDAFEMPIYEPAGDPANIWYTRRFFFHTGLEAKVQRLPKGSYYSAFTLDIFNKRVPFRIDFTVY
jgi:hypothetical protein